MKYIIDEDDFRILLRAYYQNEAIDLGKTNKDDIYDDFIDYLDNTLDVPYKNFDEGFDILVNDEIKTYRPFRQIDPNDYYGFDYTEKVCK